MPHPGVAPYPRWPWHLPGLLGGWTAISTFPISTPAWVPVPDRSVFANPGTFVGNYIGDSTRAEIAYARSLGRPVRFTHPEVDPDV